MKLIKHKNGFSLVELSISLVVIGVVLLGVMASMRSISSSSAAIKTETRMARIIDTVSNLTVGVNKLPTIAALGDNTTEQDAYGNDFQYFSAQNITLGTGTVGPRICEAKSADLSIVYREPGLADRVVKNVAYVISSNGANLTQDINHNPSTQLIINVPTSDDTYKYVSLYELKERIGCPPPDPLRIITKYLPPIIGDRTKNRNMVFTSYGISGDNVKFCLNAANTSQAALINANLQFRLLTSATSIDTGGTITAGTAACVNEAAFSTNNAKILRVEPKTGAKPGVYLFEVVVMDTLTKMRSEPQGLVQSITAIVP